MEPATEASAGRAARALWVTLVVLALARAGFALAPSMAGWGLNFSRFMDPALAWALWAAAAASLVPAFARRATAPLARLASLGARPPALAYALPALLAATLVTLLPDRVWFVGDFLLRVGILQEPEGFTRMFPQALPLDVLLHYRIPRTLGAALQFDPNQVARALGVLEAAALALLAVRFARGLGHRGPAAIATAAVVLLGGYFALYTGYGKPTIEVCLLALAVGVFGLDMVRHDRGLLAAGIATAAALGIHRAALGILPGFAAAWLLWLASHGRAGAWRRPRALVALAVPVAALATLAPRLMRLFLGFDLAVNFRSAEVEQQGGMLRAALAPLKLMDVANVLVLLSPLALAVPVLLLAHGRRLPRGREALFLGTLALGFAPSLLFVYVTQGPFRDWDAFAGAGAAISLLAAWLIGETLRSSPRRAWLAAPVLLAVMTPTLQVLVSHHDLDRGMARAVAFLAEPPRRTESQRIATWDFLGLRSLRLGRWADAADAYREVSLAAPHPRALVLWGTAAAINHDYADARRAFRALLERDPESPEGWLGLWIAAVPLGDSSAARAAGGRLRGYADDGPEMQRILVHLAHFPLLWENVKGPQVRSPLRGPAPGR